eukprot:365224-Chlamydomonas_euryale.AAC.1
MEWVCWDPWSRRDAMVYAEQLDECPGRCSDHGACLNETQHKVLRCSCRKGLGLGSAIWGGVAAGARQVVVTSLLAGSLFSVFGMRLFQSAEFDAEFYAEFDAEVDADFYSEFDAEFDADFDAKGVALVMQAQRRVLARRWPWLLEADDD